MAALACVGLTLSSAAAQTQYDGTEVAPAACYGTDEFYSPSAYPYFDNDGYFFDANPFVLARWTSTSSGIYQSSRGFSLIDQSGTKVWVNTRIAVACFEINLVLARIHFASVVAILGDLRDRSIACGGSGPITGYADAEYDPYNPSGTQPTDCTDPRGGSGGSGAGGAECPVELVEVEISYDGGSTWTTLWRGYASVCS
jgi:hypothetical protein